MGGRRRGSVLDRNGGSRITQEKVLNGRGQICRCCSRVGKVVDMISTRVTERLNEQSRTGATVGELCVKIEQSILLPYMKPS